MKSLLFAICVSVFCLFGLAVYADDTSERLEKLEDTVRDQAKTIEEQQQSINALTKNADHEGNQGGTQEAKDAPSQKASGLFGGSALANPNISLILDAFYYASNLTNDELANQGIPGFTTQGQDQRNGFNLDSVELFIFSPVDPYFNLYTNIPFTENGVSIEEAYVVTTSLPAGWQVKGGKFKSNFSRLDSQHPHAWDFWDIALPYRAFLGSEGLGGEKGVQLTYLPAWSIYTQMGVEVLQGENDLLFGQSAQEGPHAFTVFIKSSFDTGDYSTIYCGPSVLFGKTDNTNILPGTEVRADSALYGIEAVWKLKPNSREALTLQTEYLLLTQSGDTMDPTTHVVIDPLRRMQDGFYVQGIYRKNRWGVGARYDVMDLFYDTFKQGGVQQNFSGIPHRSTASVEFNPTEFTRIRLQLARDLSDPSGRTNNEAILQFNFGIGAHPAHSF
jgi:hypothetical protein